MIHKFHIPVLGLGFSIDTPLKVAKYGISSVVSIVDDELVERMRAHHCHQSGEVYQPISKKETDSRAKRITAYLNLLNLLVDRQFDAIQQMPFEAGNALCTYFELLPDESPVKHGYELMMDFPEGERKTIFQNLLRLHMEKGSIDVNIMSKVDRVNPKYQSDFTEGENTEALTALRGFANSSLSSSLTLSAGMNPRLYSYITQFDDFFPDDRGQLKKKIMLKVSDFRSALIQAKFLAKKGLWVSEFRVESGLNCGGHAFATEGYLLGPILEEFKQNRERMQQELFLLYKEALKEREMITGVAPEQKLSVQGGIGTAEENKFLMKHYQLSSTGWGSPFLLVPEVTNVDDQTLKQLTAAGEHDFYLSNASPLGIPFNNFRGSSIEQERLRRIAEGKPGSPCTKKYLVSDTEFTKEPICTASSKYQQRKIKALEALQLPADVFKKEFEAITEKICLCEGLCSSAYQRNGLLKPKESKAVAICPGPNLAYFSAVYTFGQMVDHIYGRVNLLDNVNRPHMFMKELELYMTYLHTEVSNLLRNFSDKKKLQLIKFKDQLLAGIHYYKQLADKLSFDRDKIGETLSKAEHHLALTTL